MAKLLSVLDIAPPEFVAEYVNALPLLPHTHHKDVARLVTSCALCPPPIISTAPAKPDLLFPPTCRWIPATITGDLLQHLWAPTMQHDPPWTRFNGGMVAYEARTRIITFMPGEAVLDEWKFAPLGFAWVSTVNLGGEDIAFAYAEDVE